LGIQIPALVLQRFWTMLAHYHGQIWSSNEIASSLGIAHTTARRYVDLLTGAFMVRQLPPWFENVGKRVVKSPKVYIRDSGLLHGLLNISSRPDLDGNPKKGASWEGFSIEQVLQRTGERDAYFWATHAGAELDLLLIRHGKKWGIELKLSDAPTMTKSMHIVRDDLKLEKLYVLYQGQDSYSLDKNVECIGLSRFLTNFPKNLIS